jgi:hypothetical protein
MDYLYGSSLLLNLFFLVTAIVYWVNYKKVMNANKLSELQEYSDVTYVGTDGSVGQYGIEDDVNLYIDLKNQLNYAGNVKRVQLF